MKEIHQCIVRTNHSSGRPRRVKTAEGRVKLTHQSSDRTSANFVWKKHHQPTFHETTATNSHSIRTLNSILEAAILSLLVHMLSCAWWERSVQFCLVPCNECRQCGIELSNHGPVSRGLPLNGSTAHKPTTTFVVDKQVSDLRCQLETYPWPSPINGGSSGCNLLSLIPVRATLSHQRRQNTVQFYHPRRQWAIIGPVRLTVTVQSWFNLRWKQAMYTQSIWLF